MSAELDRASSELATVRAAIDGITTGPGQSYTIAGRTFTKADLATLYAREKELMTRVNRLTRGGRRIQQIVPL